MWKKRMGSLFLVVLCGTAVLLGAADAGQVQMQQAIAKKVLRFHVLANSDSREDQAVKLAVRDAVGCYMREALSEAESREECESVVAASFGELAMLAKRTVQERGYAYEVSVALEETAFPEKSYGNYTFPAGEYKALNITIGAGKGHNWWCVLYPNMCFENSMYQVVDEKAGLLLQQTLSREEYEAVLSEGNYKIRFQYLTFLNGLCK